MIRNKNKFFIFKTVGFICLAVFSSITGQINLNNTELHESRLFVKNQIQVIQSQYLNSQGFPSHEVFLRKNGLFPENRKIQSTPYFSVSFLEEDIQYRNGDFKVKNTAEFFNLDFFVETITEHNSINVAVPIWDGRVYEDANSLMVGGYSSKFNERPVGFIDNRGLFVSQLNSADSKNFPLLQIPAEQIIFDPFEWKLLNNKPSNGETIENSSKSFLPITIHSQRGKQLNNIHYEIESNLTNSSIVLYALIDGEKFEVANCNLISSSIVKSREGYRPELIEGASQPTNGKVITFTFKGNYSNNVSISGTELYLKNEVKYTNSNNNVKDIAINIDGDFSDWRNLSGVSDIQGDYVSYLFENPDTDLLEFKITNDDKYLYFYSRVVGVHGRTGEKGRYYWYTYIDVDSDASTGYPPTRGDNCYFGIPIGDDSEAQFEFIGNKFVKTFFGFTGIGAEKEVLSGKLELGPSFYAAKGSDGKPRDKYKIEYVKMNDSLFITHDYTVGTSEDIIIALSPDGSEVEVKAELDGFLKDNSGNKLLQKGTIIDIAVGAEGSSDHYGSSNWGADSSPVIYGYEIK
ncbi:MAG: hypothetical protein GY936_18620 [Ignavibacteriae bacterium]|nr:hypothetical protein [Ignavibacteriota bacterium]